MATDLGIGTAVLFNDNLPHLAGTLQEALQEHAQQGLGCAVSDFVVAAKQQALDALRDEDPFARKELEAPRLLEVYGRYGEVLHLCPQAVLQATGAKLEGLLQQLRSSCNSEMVHACRATTPFMFDVFIYYVLLKYGLVDLYARAGNVSAEVYDGWPVEQQERRLWYLFGALWRVIWPQRDYCACVEAYDYHTTMHALFETSLNIGRGDLHQRLLRKGSEIRRVVEAAEYCEEWLEKDFQRIFSSYAKHSACLPGALMENMVCLQRWLLSGKVAGSLNTAEMMVKLLTLSDTCLEDTKWPFTKADVMYNFARLAFNWRAGNVGCHAMDRFGQQLQTEHCAVLGPEAYGRLLWRPSPLAAPASEVECTFDFSDACVVEGVVTVRQSAPLSAPEHLQSCSETGRNRHPLRLVRELDTIDRAHVGFVLNLPESGDNVWHNLHWLVPAVARLARRRTQPRNVLLMLLFDAYLFREDELEPAQNEVEKELQQAEQMQRFEQWVVRHAPMLRLLTSAPPVLLHSVKRRCFEVLLWGHAEMRADRELRHRTAVKAEDVAMFKEALGDLHGKEMDAMAAKFWQRAMGSASSGQDLQAAPELVLHRLLLMRPGAQVLEWIPRGVQPCLYRCSEQWNVDGLGMFGGLGRLALVDHVCLRSEAALLQVPDSKRFSAARATAREAYWRHENLAVDGFKLARWVAEAVRRAEAKRSAEAEADVAGEDVKEPEPKRARTDAEILGFEALRRVGYGAEAEAEEAARAKASLEGSFCALQQKAKEEAASRFKVDQVVEQKEEEDSHQMGCEEPPESIEVYDEQAAQRGEDAENQWPPWSTLEAAEEGLTKPLVDAMRAVGFTEPTPIQAQAWPILCSGRDLIGVARTGSGKTLAFLLPCFAILLKEGLRSRMGTGTGPGDDSSLPVQMQKQAAGPGAYSPEVLVIAPSRELAAQIETEARRFTAATGIVTLA
ncbi:unnamed protein product, partial [Effrenium voratum]